MCGIFSVISKTEHPLDLSRCLRSLSKLSWRGPDLSTHLLWGNNVFLGQSILSITGNIRSDQGDHLRSTSGRFYLGFNGEIYNYKSLENCWLTQKLGRNEQRTDSEVLVNLHETKSASEIPPLLDGMYGYVILDTQNKTITICRDPQGEKSLFIYENSDHIIISSEISPILSFNPSISIEPQSLKDYFCTRHMMLFERTVYSGIKQLPPGQIQSLDLHSLKWEKPVQQTMADWIMADKMDSNETRSVEDLLDELEAIMEKCVLEMIPKRPFATVVSGGIDSSLVSSFLLKHGNPQLCVAINHVGKDQISNDLLGFEAALTRKVDVIDVDLAAYSAEIERCQKACGSPLFSHSFVGQSIQSAYVRSKGNRVLFGGEGADELFGGYACYLSNRSVNSRFCPSPYTNYKPELSFVEDNSTLIQTELEEAWQFSIQAYQHLQDPEEQASQAMMYCDLAYQLPSVGMRGADLMSMMWSVETRSVFLRKPIVQFALNLPVRLKSNTSEKNQLLQSKCLLKKLFLRHFPSELLVQKQGFSGFPNESAIYLGNLKDYSVLDVLGISYNELQKKNISRDTEWKLINIEHFLRHSWNH